MHDDESLNRDVELAKKVGNEIESTLEALHRAVNQNRHEEVVQLGSSLRDQCSAYRDLREIT